MAEILRVYKTLTLLETLTTLLEYESKSTCKNSYMQEIPFVGPFLIFTFKW